ncbi:MAG: carboxypeptidase-like regulatory domain-containing protein [Ignavibacteriales bacterium]|nr:carboxypeptidase-like regulatory domain-containing protein [Ignavibacteriales bacterium]
MKRFFPLLITLFVAFQTSFTQTFTLSGTVRDSSNGESLIAANIRVDGTAKGTITNALGAYKLSLEKGKHVILYSFIGYKTDTLHLNVDKPLEVNVRLRPSAIQLSEVVVTGEDPAIAIMRKVIENKKRWSEALKTYQLEAFTRIVIRRDTAIASIVESYSTGYWQKGDTLREIVKQKRQTENVAGSANFAAVGGIANFYDDEVRLGGFRFVGPTSQEAFDYYDFKLEKTRERDGVAIYIISLNPKTRLVPLFYGTISVIGNTYAVVGVDVIPNEAYTIPFLSDFRFNYAQQFGLYDSIYWMPVDVRMKGWAKVGIVGLSFPRIGFDRVVSIYDYKINTAIPDTIFRKPRLVTLPGAEKFDSLFWAQREVLPLTEEEQTAYKTLDSTQSLDKQFRPGGVLALLGSGGLSFFKYADVRFDRVEGLFLGPTLTLDSLTNRLRVLAAVGYGFSDKKTKFSLGGELFLDSRREYSIGLEGYQGVDHIPDGGYYNDFAITLSALLDKNDYRDYFYTKGWKLFATAQPLRKVVLRLQYQNEEQTTALQRTDYSLLSRDVSYRLNPAIQNGMMRSLQVSARYGDPAIPLGIISQDFIELKLEHSDKSLLASDFDFSQLTVHGELHIATFMKRLFIPPTLSLSLTAGVSSGTVPAQRWFTLDSRYTGFAPFGVLRGGDIKEFSGNRFVLLSVEHNFRSSPFLALDIPFLYKNSVELLVHGTLARTWNSNSTPMPFGRITNDWYSEAGIGLSRIFGLFRLDYTYRFAEPRNAFVSLGVARIF